MHEPTLVDHRCFNIHIESLGALNASLLDLHITYNTNTVCYWHLANVNPHIDHSAVHVCSLCVYTQREQTCTGRALYALDHFTEV